jgi:hypothetical protein
MFCPRAGYPFVSTFFEIQVWVVGIGGFNFTNGNLFQLWDHRSVFYYADTNRLQPYLLPWAILPLMWELKVAVFREKYLELL